MGKSNYPSNFQSAWEIEDDLSASQTLGIGLFAAAAVVIASKMRMGKFARGPKPGKRGKRNIGRQDGARQIDRDYFCRKPEHVSMTLTFSEEEFERRYRIPRDVYEVIREGVLGWEDNYFIEKRDCCGSYIHANGRLTPNAYLFIAIHAHQGGTAIGRASFSCFLTYFTGPGSRTLISSWGKRGLDAQILCSFN
jgi:hypothetical protein